MKGSWKDFSQLKKVASKKNVIPRDLLVFFVWKLLKNKNVLPFEQARFLLKNKKYFLISVIVYIIFLSFMIEVSKEAGERKMDIGFIGLGKMGLNMALNVHEQGSPLLALM